MAYSFTAQANGVGVPFNYTRGNPIPLDSWSLFSSYEAAVAYAQSNPVSYPGQVVSVIDGTSSIVYVIAGGALYTREMKDEDDANAETEGYTPHAPGGTEVGAELTATRTLVRLGTKAEIESASASAIMNWLNADGTETT